MKKKQELQKVIVERKCKFEDIFANDTRTCIECLNELKKQQMIDERECIIKRSWRIQ